MAARGARLLGEAELRLAGRCGSPAAATCVNAGLDPAIRQFKLGLHSCKWPRGHAVCRRDERSYPQNLRTSRRFGRGLHQEIRRQETGLFEAHETAAVAIQREKNIKHWSREWKIDLIVSMNADWRDLYDDFVV
jgi:hypothetical protein